MPNLELLVGDFDHSESGEHVLDANGVAVILLDAKTVAVPQEVYDWVLPLIEADRASRQGKNADGTAIEPPPPPAAACEPLPPFVDVPCEPFVMK